ncbi:MAG: hypothetical protein R2852_01515 [Bacteroidia bacterium]
MYYLKSLIFCVFAGVLSLHAQDSSRIKASSIYRNSTMFCVNYGRQVPIGKLNDRFGSSNSIGFTVGYKFGKNWQIQGGINTMFSGKVKENGVLDSMIGNGGLLVDINGTYAEVRMYQRGYHWHVDFGKIIPLGHFDVNSGLLLTAGVGFMQHKIKFTYQRTVLPQLESNYFKGYDRLTNGLMIRGFVGYQRIDSKSRLNFVAGLEFLEGFTYNRRSFNYDTRQRETELRKDILVGLKLGIMVSLSGRQAGKNKGDEERFFE